MKRTVRTSLSTLILLVITACNLFGPPQAVAPGTSVVKLEVRAQNGVTTYNRAGDVITYEYVVTNTGATPLAGSISINDSPRIALCPDVNTVGNLNSFLDFNESITCRASYTITETDISNGTLTNSATATVGGVLSSAAGVTLTRAAPAQPGSLLRLVKTANSQTYGQVGQQIVYNYDLTNTGTTPLGPDQFTVSDNKFSAPFNCGDPNTTIQPAQTLRCTATYTITQADLNNASLTNSATASGASQTSTAATFTLSNLNVTQTPSPATPTSTPSTGLVPGSTITHRVAVGEWLFQIARCYGANINELLAANPQIRDPDLILRDELVTVPRIGSLGTIYGPQDCVVFYNVQNGDTWNSIADRNNACLAVLQLANRNTLTVGASIKIPRNSRNLYCPTSTTGPQSTAQPGATNTPSTGTTQRITIEPGKTNAILIGYINPNETLRFLLNASQGQFMAVKVTAPPNEVALGVNSPTGIALKTLDTGPTWSSSVSTSGDHIITLAAVLGNSSKQYTLEVSLTASATPTFTPTATATPTPTGTQSVVQ